MEGQVERQQGSTEDQNAEQVRRFLDSAKQPHFTLGRAGYHATAPISHERLKRAVSDDLAILCFLENADVGDEFKTCGGAAHGCTIRRVS